VLKFPGLRTYQQPRPTLSRSTTYTDTISDWPIPLIVLPDLVEVILVQLADETCKVGVFEVFGEDGFREFLVLSTTVRPISKAT